MNCRAYELSQQGWKQGTAGNKAPSPRPSASHRARTRGFGTTSSMGRGATERGNLCCRDLYPLWQELCAAAERLPQKPQTIKGFFEKGFFEQVGYLFEQVAYL